jgi:HK97 family phage prohead protease
MSVTLREAADKRAEAADKARSTDPDKLGRSFQRAAPGGVVERWSAPMTVEMRAEEVTRNGKSFLLLSGMASVYERSYDMWDYYGPYTEVVSEGAGKVSLSGSPDVVNLANHRGNALARTISGTLDLSEPGGGLLSEAYLNPKRQDAMDQYNAVEDGSMTEMSFAFRIAEGRWSPDYTEYRIDAYDIDRGDTSQVNFGANPETSVEARASRFLLQNEARWAGLLVDAPDSGGAEPVEALSLRNQAATDLRHLRASLVQGAALTRDDTDAIVGVIDALLDDPQRLAREGHLADILNLRGVKATEAPVGFIPTSVEFLARELDAARTF